jgi:hypothetical protein
MRSARIALVRPLLLTAALAGAACGDGDIAADSARMAADTFRAAAAPPTAGPLPPVATAADAGLVMDATEFRITDQNYQQFVRASEALSYLRARDMNVRSMLDQAGTTADSTTGSILERLERHPQIAQAINDAGMSVRDYYVMAIALHSAQRHAANPEGAPPASVGRANAEWASRNRSQLARLQTWGAAVAR